MSRFDYADPSTDPAYCDALSTEPLECILCGNISDDDMHSPYCSESCVRQADGESDEDENPRERGDDDGVEYGDPRDYRNER